MKLNKILAPIFILLIMATYVPAVFAEDTEDTSTDNTEQTVVDYTTQEDEDVKPEATLYTTGSTKDHPRIRKGFSKAGSLPSEEDPRKMAFNSMLQWGNVDGNATDATELNWKVEIWIDSGKVQLIGDPLLFEGIDKMDEQIDANKISAITKTTNHWDGLIVKIVPESREESNMIHVRIGDFIKDYTLQDFYGTYGVYDLNNGKQVAVRSFHKNSNMNEEKRVEQFNQKLSVLKRLTKIHELIGELLDAKQLSRSEYKNIFNVLKRLEANEYSSEDAGKWIRKITSIISRLENANKDDVKNTLLDEVADINTDFDMECRASVKNDFKEGYVPFEDTPQCDWYTGFVKRLKDAKVVNGMKGTNNFAPGNSISRAELLAIALSSAGVNVDASGEVDTVSEIFADSKGHWAERGIRYAVQRGLVKGYEDGFRPNHQITRAEALAMVYKVFKLEADTECTATFNDTEDHWAKCIIENAKSIGVVNGYEDGSFKPNESITRAAMAKIISNLVDFIQALPQHQEL